MKPLIFDGETHREMSDSEFLQYELDQEEAAARAATQAAKLAAREAVLAKLGLSEQEASALLG